MSDLPPPRTPAGWYPTGALDELRWWDGDAWTDETTDSDGLLEGGTSPLSAPADPGPTTIRGITGYASLEDGRLVYRSKLDRPVLQAIDLHTVDRLLISRDRNLFDLGFVGSARRTRPSFFSETSLRRSGKTPMPDWTAFLAVVEAAIAAAQPKRSPGDSRR